MRVMNVTYFGKSYSYIMYLWKWLWPSRREQCVFCSNEL